MNFWPFGTTVTQGESHKQHMLHKYLPFLGHYFGITVL